MSWNTLRLFGINLANAAEDDRAIRKGAT
jgi:hypothetical protein